MMGNRQTSNGDFESQETKIPRREEVFGLLQKEEDSESQGTIALWNKKEIIQLQQEEDSEILGTKDLRKKEEIGQLQKEEDSESQETKDLWNIKEIRECQKIENSETYVPQKKEENQYEEKIENSEPKAPQNKEENQQEEKIQNSDQQKNQLIQSIQQQLNNPAQCQIPEIINIQQNCLTCEQLQKKVIKYKSAALKFHNEQKILNHTVFQKSEEISSIKNWNLEIKHELQQKQYENTVLLEQNQRFKQQLLEFQICNEKLLKSEQIILDLENRIKQEDQKLINQMKQSIQNGSNQSSINQDQQQQQNLNIQSQDSIQNNSQSFEMCFQQLNKNIIQLEDKLGRKKDKIKTIEKNLKQNQEAKGQQIEQLNTSNCKLLKQLEYLASECWRLLNLTFSTDIFGTINTLFIQKQSQIDNLVNTINNQNYQFYNYFGLQFSPESMIQIKDYLDQNNKYHNERYSKLEREYKAKSQQYQEKIQDLEIQDSKNQSQIRNLIHKCELQNKQLRQFNEDLDSSFNQNFGTDIDDLKKLNEQLKIKNTQLVQNLNQKEITINKQSEMLDRKEREIQIIYEDNQKVKQSIQLMSLRQKNDERNKINQLKLGTLSKHVDQCSQTVDQQLQQLVIQQMITNQKFYNSLLSQNLHGQKDPSIYFDFNQILNLLGQNNQFFQDNKNLFQVYQLRQNYCDKNWNFEIQRIEQLECDFKIKVSPFLKLQSAYKYQLMELIVNKPVSQKDKIYIIKSQQSLVQPYKQLQSVFKQATNNQLLNLFLWNFEKELQMFNIKYQSFKIPQAFILKNKAAEEYYYIEEIQNGKYTKYDQIIEEELHVQNAVLSLYSYYLSQGRMMITTINSVGFFYYDTYISTMEGQLSGADQGEVGIKRRLEFINNYRNMFDKYKRILEGF